MKLIFLPALSEMREMLGDELYVELVWMWRERDQQARSEERRVRWNGSLPKGATALWPKPIFAPARPAMPESPEAGKRTACGIEQIALMRPILQRLSEPRVAKELPAPAAPGGNSRSERAVASRR